MKISVQSGNIYTDRNFKDGLDRIKRAGFDCIDFNINLKISYDALTQNGENPFFSKSLDEIIEYYRPHKEYADKIGLKYGQMHAPYPVFAPNNPDASEALKDAIIKSMAVCNLFECPYLVVHPIITDASVEEEERQNIEFYTSLIPYIKKYKIVVCLENMFNGQSGHVVEAVCSDFSIAAKYIDTLNEIAGSEIFGFCYDVGHATLLGKNQRKSLNILGKRVKALHIHDNDGREDLHMQPFAYMRGRNYVTEWDSFLSGLSDIGYNGTLSFETHHSLVSLPVALKDAMLSYIAAVGHYFSDVLENIKPE